MAANASQITSLAIVYSTVYSDADQRKHQSFTLLAFVRGIHRWPVNSPHKWPVTRKMFPFDDVIMESVCQMAPILYRPQCVNYVVSITGMSNKIARVTMTSGFDLILVVLNLYIGTHQTIFVAFPSLSQPWNGIDSWIPSKWKTGRQLFLHIQYHDTGPLCGEFTGHRWIPLTKASDAELRRFLWSAPE